MSIEIECPSCGASHRVVQRLLGRTLRCPKCDHVIAVPTAEELRLAAEAEQAKAERARAAAAIPEAEIVSVDQIPPSITAVVPMAKGAMGNAAALDELPETVPFGKRKKRQADELDMTAMVDVTFLLLIFFMVTASFSLRKAIPVPAQRSDAPSSVAVDQDPDEVDQVTVQVDEFNSFLVLAPDWERETPGKQNLINALREAFTLQSGGMRLAIECHEKAKLQALVDAMDAGALVGFTELQITTVEQFD